MLEVNFTYATSIIGTKSHERSTKHYKSNGQVRLVSRHGVGRRYEEGNAQEDIRAKETRITLDLPQRTYDGYEGRQARQGRPSVLRRGLISLTYLHNLLLKTNLKSWAEAATS